MNIEIIEKPIQFHLYGIGGVVENERYGEVGLRLMNEVMEPETRPAILGKYRFAYVEPTATEAPAEAPDADRRAVGEGGSPPTASARRSTATDA